MRTAVSSVKLKNAINFVEQWNLPEYADGVRVEFAHAHICQEYRYVRGVQRGG